MAISVAAMARPGAAADPIHQNRLPWMTFGHDAQYNYQHELHITSKKVTAGEQNRGGDASEDCCEGRRVGAEAEMGLLLMALARGCRRRSGDAKRRRGGAAAKMG